MTQETTRTEELDKREAIRRELWGISLAKVSYYGNHLPYFLSHLSKEAIETLNTLLRYNACLKKIYGVELGEIREESTAAWEHFIAAAQKGIDPENAVRHLGKVFFLIPADSKFFERPEAAEIYNRYRIALVSYAESYGLCGSPTSPVEIIAGKYLVWDVEIIKNKEEKGVTALFCLRDFGGNSYYGMDINSTRDEAYKAIRDAKKLNENDENSFNQSRLNP